MGRVGIVTWYKNGNYGGSLQAFAMAKTLEKFGINPIFINHYHRNRLARTAKRLGFGMLYPQSAKSRNKIFHFAKKRLPETKTMRGLEQMAAYARDLDAVICGSDQIWNSKSGANPIFFLQFASAEKRIAYAPSIGLPEIADEYLETFREYVSSIPHLSVRETYAAAYIQEKTGIVPKVVLDPTLLLEREEWLALASDRVCRERKLKKKGYILCYFLGDHHKYAPFVREMEKKTGYPVYYISTGKRDFKAKHLVCDPLEFAGLLGEAAYVLTDSFHGLVLSSTIGTPVAVFERFSQTDRYNENSRIYSIVELLGLKALVKPDATAVEDFMNQDHAKNDALVMRKQAALREESLRFLESSLEAVLKHSLQ